MMRRKSPLSENVQAPIKKNNNNCQTKISVLWDGFFPLMRCETYLKCLELSVFNFNEIYLATIKLKTNKEIGQRATVNISLFE